MYLPISADLPTIHEGTAPGVHLLTYGTSGKGGGWSSLIGIITAICGNILISFALNTQRYAHIRLSRERDEWEEKQRAGERRNRALPRTYGTQADIAEERARKNAESDAAGGAKGDYTLEEAEEGSEAEPLIPRVDIRRASVGSDDTARPNQKDKNSPEGKVKKRLKKRVRRRRKRKKKKKTRKKRKRRKRSSWRKTQKLKVQSMSTKAMWTMLLRMRTQTSR